MTLDLHDCTLSGSALTEPFLRDGLPRLVDLRSGIEPAWDAIRGSLRGGGAGRVHQHVTARFATAFGYRRPRRQPPVATREGEQDGGWLLAAANGANLRAWSVPTDIDLDGAGRSVRAIRSSPTRSAQRVLLARNERVGLLTNGDVVRLLLCDPVRSDSCLSVGIGGWQRLSSPPNSSGF